MISDDSGKLPTAVRRKGSFWRSLKAVAWSFFGVRRASDYAQDVAELNPLHIVLAGLLAVALFIGLLIAVVQWVLSSGVAA